MRRARERAADMSPSPAKLSTQSDEMRGEQRPPAGSGQTSSGSLDAAELAPLPAAANQAAERMRGAGCKRHAIAQSLSLWTSSVNLDVQSDLKLIEQARREWNLSRSFALLHLSLR
mgnify:CR=1 FL=1